MATPLGLFDPTSVPAAWFDESSQGAAIFDETLADAGSSAAAYDDTLSEPGTAADVLTSAATLANALAEPGSAGDALTSSATFPNPIAESGATADALAGVAIYPAALSEGAAAADSVTGGAATSNSLTEAGAAGDAVTGGLLTSDAVTEAGGAADALSSVQAFALSLAEAGAAVDALVALGIWPNDLAEAGAVVDAIETSATFASALSESGIAADLVDAPLPVIYDDPLTEAAFAVDAYDAGPLPVLAPPPSDQFFGTVIIVNRIGRKAVVYDERLTEGAQAGDTASSIVGWMEALLERANAVDAMGARAEMRATIGEALAPGAALQGSTAIGMAIAEEAAASDALEMRGAFNPSDEVLALTLLFGDDLVVKAAVKPIDRDREKVAQAREAIQRQFGEFFAHLSLHLATIARGIRKAEEEDDPVLAAAEAADYAGTVNAAKPHLREVAKDGAGHGLAQVGAGGHETLMQAHQLAVDWAEERAGELVGEIEETTREGVRDLVARALAEGWTNDELADALVGSGVFSASRAERIARTEVAMADVQGSLIGWQESGVVAGKEWKTGGGPCDECDELDGEVVPLDDEFPDGDPPLHPNCRCDVLPVLAEDEE